MLTLSGNVRIVIKSGVTCVRGREEVGGVKKESIVSIIII